METLLWQYRLSNRLFPSRMQRRLTCRRHAHADLNRAVWAAYGWDDPVPAGVAEDTILSRLLAQHRKRGVK